MLLKHRLFCDRPRGLSNRRGLVSRAHGGTLETHQKQPVLAVGFASVINKHSGWIELQLKPAISTEKKSCVTQLQ